MLSRNQGHQIIDMTYPSQESIEDSSEKSLLHKFGLIHPYFHGKTRHCKHDFGCLENILKDTVKSFVYGYGIKVLLSFAGLLLRARTTGISLKRLLECVISQGNLKSGAFFGVMTLLMKSLICILRKMRKKEDWRNSFVAGALAGYCSLFFVQDKSRVFFATFFLSRAFDCCYNSLVKRKVIKESSLNYVVIFMLINGLTVYARFHEPYLVPPSLSHFYEFVYAKGPMEAQLEHVLTTMTQRRLIKKSVLS